MRIEDELREMELFDRAPDAALEQAIRASRPLRPDGGARLQQQGEIPPAVCLVLQGTVRLRWRTVDGATMQLGLAGRGSLVGLESLAGGRAGVAEVAADEGTSGLQWEPAAFERLLQAHPALARGVLDQVVRCKLACLERMAQLGTETVEQRLARWLVRLARDFGRPAPRGVQIVLRLTGQDLAELTAAGRYTVSRVMSGWKRERLLESSRGRVSISDLAALETIAEGGLR